MKDYSNYEKWFEAQPQEVKDLLTERFTALENTVKATRQERDSLSTELRELGKKAEKGSELELKLSEITSRMTQAEKKATFLEKAHKEGCLRPSAAYAIASAENMFDDQGEPDFKKLRETTPELFRVRDTKTNAGSGTRQAAITSDPTEALREAARNNPRR